MILEEMMQHAAEAAPHEACGLVVMAGKKHRLVRARNLADQPTLHFDLDPEAWLDVKDHEEVIGIYHSHPNGRAQPSQADRTSCELSGLPWHIVGYPSGEYTRIEPCGYEAPYLERPYVWGVHDCYTLICDWYRREFGIQLEPVLCKEGWWNRGENLYVELFASRGFVEVKDEPREGDVLLIQVNSPVPNHGAIHLGNGTILQHVQGRLSTKDRWGGVWAKHCTHVLRHNAKMGITNG